LDTCVWGGVRSALSDAGHDVIWAGDWPIDPGDEEILEQAHFESQNSVAATGYAAWPSLVRLCETISAPAAISTCWSNSSMGMFRV
jgi:hypothetical protein